MISTQTATLIPKNIFSTGCSSYSHGVYSPNEYSSFDLPTVVSHSSLNFKRKRSLFVEPTHKHTPRPVKRLRVSLDMNSKTDSNDKTPTEQELLNSALASFRFSQGVRIFDLSNGETLEEVNENYTTSKASRRTKSHSTTRDIELKKDFDNIETTSPSKSNCHLFPTPSSPCKNFEAIDPLPTLVVEPSTRIISMEID